MEKTTKEGTWFDFAKRYKPDITEDELEYILWNETCYPFSDEIALKQLEDFLNKNK